LEARLGISERAMMTNVLVTDVSAAWPPAGTLSFAVRCGAAGAHAAIERSSANHKLAILDLGTALCSQHTEVSAGVKAPP